jgi:hypothetical protein
MSSSRSSQLRTPKVFASEELSRAGLLAAVKSTFDSMKPVSMFATLASARLRRVAQLILVDGNAHMRVTITGANHSSVRSHRNSTLLLLLADLVESLRASLLTVLTVREKGAVLFDNVSCNVVKIPE